MARSTTLTKPIRWGESMSDFVLPTGTVTLLLADIEGSVRLWESRAPEMTKAIAKHDALVSELIGKHGGVKPKDQGEGDSFVAAFARPSEALACALALQLAISKQDWSGAEIRLRAALHTGEVELRNEVNYVGSTISRAARLRDLGHGGQTLLSAATYDLVADRLPQSASIKELGFHRLRDLSRPEHVYQLNHPGLSENFQPLRSLEALPNNLPIQLTSFVGREKEIEEINSLLQDNRMVTLTGSGGAGKTRLALHVAADLIEDFEGGVWLADLAPLRDPMFVAQAVAAALGLPEEKDRDALATLIDHVKSRRALIVLDNCEHLVNECADLASALLHASSSLTIIATSREPLGVEGEIAWRVPSLSLPDPKGTTLVEGLSQFEAVRLFIDRAMKGRPNFKISNENAPAVAQICHRLDGIPLAIELAAARVRVLSPEQISEGLADRFHLLTGGARTAMPRQQTLQASVEWSYDSLGDKERMLLQRLSVFVGGFTLDAAEGVGSGDGSEITEILDLLTQLVDKSLVVMDDLQGVSVRYHLLETIRQYAMERVLESGAVQELRTRQMNHFIEYGKSLGVVRTYDPEAARIVRELRLEVDNLRAAARWGLSNAEPDVRLRLAAFTSGVLTDRGSRREALTLIDEALGASEGASLGARSRALVAKGWIIFWLDPSTLFAVGEEALRLAEEAGDSSVAAEARTLMAQGALALGDAAKVESVDEMMKKAIEAGSDEQFVALAYRGSNFVAQGDFAAAVDLFEQAAELARAASHRAWLVTNLGQQAIFLALLGAFDRAEKIALDARALVPEGVRPFAIVVFALGMVPTFRGEYDRAREYFEEGLEQARATEDTFMEGTSLFVLGYLDVLVEKADLALEKLREGARIIDQLGGWSNAATGPGLALYGDAFRLARDLESGRTLMRTIREQNPSEVAVIVAILNEAKMNRDVGRFEEAETQAFEVLPELQRFASPMWIVDALELIGGLVASRDSHVEAARLLAAAQSARDEIGYVRFPVERPDHDAMLAKTRDALGKVFEATWEEGAVLSLDDAVGLALRGRGERKRPTAGWSSLTPAELRVSDLVAEGLSNPKIAERLYISRHTVETHLKNIFAKMGFTSRTQLASEATRRH